MSDQIAMADAADIPDEAVPGLTPAPLQSDPVHPPARVAWVDVARGLSIVAVVIYHTQGYLGISSALQGQAGVDAFLILSGKLL
jgi:peptidoglycan/LPS O-acetylase OafA/YrhL